MITHAEFVQKVGGRLTCARVQLDRWLEPHSVFFVDSVPDRLLAGQAAYDKLVAIGFEPVLRETPEDQEPGAEGAR